MVEDAVSGAKIAPCLPPLAVIRLPLCLRWGEGTVHSRLALLWYSLSPLFCEWVRLSLKAFQGKFLSLSLSFFSLSDYPSLGCNLTLSSDCPLSSLRLSSGHSSLVPTLSPQPEPPCSSPHLLLVDPSVWATSPLGVAIRCVIYWGFFHLPVMLPSEIPKLPTDLPVRGFPGVWKLLLLHDSLPRMGLYP